jgi:uncharacterized surface protein with fasciclin (FAS1) repeats
MQTIIVALVAVIAAVNGATILQIAQSNPAFSTLVSVAAKTGIAPLLGNTGFKTVFAPTNEAFGKLGNNTLGWITNDHNQQHLLSTLYYHIAPGQLKSTDFKPPQNVLTLDQSLEGPLHVTVTADASGVKVNQASVTQANVIADNGVIHVINGVLVPSNIHLPSNDIVQTAIATPALSTLVKAVVAAGLANALSQPNGPYVVFAPTDAAFAAVPSTVLNCLLGNPAALRQVLLFHVAEGFVYSEAIQTGTTVNTLAGKSISFTSTGGVISINYGSGFTPSNVVIPNVDTSNGVVHVIDRVLFDNTGPCAQKLGATF